MKKMRTVYGPVPSWRLGRSLGVDPICQNACSFDCIYCQIGPTIKKTYKRDVFVDTKRIKRDLKEIMPIDADIVTFSSCGEPTLAKNLDEILEVVRDIVDLPVAILTNSSTLPISKVRRILRNFDKVIAKVDAPNDKIFNEINRPIKGIHLGNIISGIKKFRKIYDGELEIQTMFVEKNKQYSKELAELIKSLDPDLVYINTPLRPSLVEPLSEKEIKRITKDFEDLKFRSVYEYRYRGDVSPLDKEALRRRPAQ